MKSGRSDSVFDSCDCDRVSDYGSCRVWTRDGDDGESDCDLGSDCHDDDASDSDCRSGLLTFFLSDRPLFTKPAHSQIRLNPNKHATITRKETPNSTWHNASPTHLGTDKDVINRNMDQFHEVTNQTHHNKTNSRSSHRLRELYSSHCLPTAHPSCWASCSGSRRTCCL